MKLKVKQTVLVGLAFMTISSFWQLYDFTVPKILKDVFAVSDSVSGIVMSLDNVLALFLLPIFGSLSDKIKSPYGKRMPFIVVGTIVAVTSMMILPYASENRILWLFVIGLAVVLLAMSTYRSPAVALMPDVTIKPLRSKANAIINLMGSLGASFFLLLNAYIAPQDMGSYYPIFIAVALFMLIGMTVMVFTIQENKMVKVMQEESVHYGIDESIEESLQKTELKPEVRRSLSLILLSISLWFMGYNAVISAFSRYATIEMGLTEAQASLTLLLANIGAIVSFIPIGFVSSKIGRKKTILFGVVALAFAFLTAGFYRSFTPLVYGNFLLAGVAWASINVNSLPMVLEMAKGSDVGRYTGLYYTFSMSAQIITPILSGVLFDLTGNYLILFPYAAFFVFLSFVTMTQVRHGDSKIDSYLDNIVED